MLRFSGRKSQGSLAFLNLWRWVNWILAVVLLYLQATPAVPLVTDVLAYSSVLIYNGMFTIWPIQIEALLRRRPYLILFDWLLCWFLLYAYGWGSPFYVYTFSTVVLGGILLGLRGSFAMAAISALGYQAAVSLNGKVWAEIVKIGEIDTHIFQVFDYFLVAIFFSYPVTLSEKLRRANDELLVTQGKIERLVLAKERQRIAQDIHDNVTQSLLGVKLMIETSLSKDHADEQLKEQLLVAQAAAGKAMLEVREAVDDLFADRLGKLSAREILEQVVRKTKETHGLSVDISCSGKENPLILETKKTIYLVVQEAISNSIKHGSASAVEIGMVCSEDAIQLTVSDNGRGFDPQSVGPGHGHGHGLTGLANRLESLGGSSSVKSRPGSGTIVVMDIPMKVASEVLVGAAAT